MGVRDHFPILWLHWPFLMRGYETIFCWPSRKHIYCSVDPLECIFMAPLTLFNEAPKHKNVALLALYNAYLWLCLKSHIFGAIC